MYMEIPGKRPFRVTKSPNYTPSSRYYGRQSTRETWPTTSPQSKPQSDPTATSASLEHHYRRKTPAHRQTCNKRSRQRLKGETALFSYLIRAGASAGIGDLRHLSTS